jgi:mRNA interferase MazF
MAGFVKGDVVVIPFPFSDLSGNKRRPALVLATLPGNDIILCQITSRNRKDKFTLALSLADFISGSLPVESYIRPNRIFTADKTIIVRKAGIIKKNVMNTVTETLVELFNS